MKITSKLYENEKVRLKNTLFFSHLPTSAYTNSESVQANLLKLAFGPAKVVAGAVMTVYGAVMFWVPGAATKFDRITTLDATGVHDSAEGYIGWKSACDPFKNFTASFTIEHNGKKQSIDQIVPFVGYGFDIRELDPETDNFEFNREGLEQHTFELGLSLSSLNSSGFSNSSTTTINNSTSYEASRNGAISGRVIRLLNGYNYGIGIKAKDAATDVQIAANSSVELGGSNFFLAGINMVLDGACETIFAVPKSMYYAFKYLRDGNAPTPTPANTAQQSENAGEEQASRLESQTEIREPETYVSANSDDEPVERIIKLAVI